MLQMGSNRALIGSMPEKLHHPSDVRVFLKLSVLSHIECAIRVMRRSANCCDTSA